MRRRKGIQGRKEEGGIGREEATTEEAIRRKGKKG